ncbi:MAG: DUF4406 domain-containing protein, partial [Candidatus Pacebacteria bacterium]|nr:DUF4406 domain-containing protein [Candidatus Paceibacterota bacterium]
MTIEEKHQKLTDLAQTAIERLRELPAPVVRVSGPLTSGGYGYDENHRRFIVAQEKLREQGFTVFDYFEGNHDERHIIELALPWEEVMEYYHKPIMATGLITTVFMMPKWRESNGATWEHLFAEELNLQIR